jgi:riboflavin synthase
LFTGIIEETGIVLTIDHGVKSSQITVQAKMVIEDVKTGDSINTNGVCLTVISSGPGYFKVDVMPETIRKTNLSNLKPGSKVNLERSLRLMDRIGGHLVSGHIDGTGKIIRRWEEDIAVWFEISADPEVLRYMVNKGSVALDGISLTVVNADTRSFSVSVIPHNGNVHTLRHKKTGDIVNVECDILAKYVEKLQYPNATKSNIDIGFLERNEFI